MNIDQAIDRLESLKESHGGDAPVVVSVGDKFAYARFFMLDITDTGDALTADCCAFMQYSQGQWQVDPLTPYAWEYHERCEAFDRTVCSKIVGGVAQPATSEEGARVIANAKRVKDELYDRIRCELGPHEVSLLQRAINTVSRDFERSMRKRSEKPTQPVIQVHPNCSAVDGVMDGNPGVQPESNEALAHLMAQSLVSHDYVGICDQYAVKCMLCQSLNKYRRGITAPREGSEPEQ